MTVIGVNDLMHTFTTWTTGTIAASVSRWWRVTFVFGGADIPLCVSKLHSFMSSSVNFLIGNATWDVVTHLRQYRSGVLLDEIVTLPSTQTTSTPSLPLPPMCCLMHSLRPEVIHPRSVSRMYWPCPAKENVGSDGRLSSLGQTRMDDVATGLKQLQFIFLDGQAVRCIAAVCKKDGTYLGDVFTVDTCPFVTTQRRRNLGNQKASWNG